MSAQTSHRKTVLGLLGVISVMATLAWAAVPLYDWFCRVTGYGGTTSVAETASDQILDQTIRVRFDASRARDMPWEFRPIAPHMDVRIGETGLAFYEAYNPTDRPIAGTASYNVAPFDAGSYFVKIACFCFEMQVLEPGERVQMPVTFYVDPEIVDDPETRGTPAITLSYTFHVTDIPEDYAALDAGTASAGN
ncbi:Cytochrome oxidase biogenesis protein Cox11-CtaG, copper delivery to Cox1 [Roseibacterium elongatum DSM 19469]|uniref:Cytochrome c oxidase assembly protein CtaG n=1 Tax=Roseicyclus elongatus DSM 19469 TaxID=1294273 RepID=W8RNF1_9RHOB|nr:cytochrome c oxidase assembly protein [Roseibacterium elongatum]AHM02528.1 Cytochrome oxidase biogenesis protein Cox11-CtaG, copper delivery to Cox1 [Roseibacterium elongatum DSM 19469]